jgi:uncharacterized protein YecE (DUF72 family)
LLWQAKVCWLRYLAGTRTNNDPSGVLTSRHPPLAHNNNVSFETTSKAQAMSQVSIGCSGFKYSHWRNGIFYPKGLKQKNEFAHYASRFNTVELNSTFYILPKEKTWQNWHDKAPKEFIYALKMSRWLTHNKKLNDPKEAWERFWKGAQKLHGHLGPILFQLPPRFKYKISRLRDLFEVLPPKIRFAFEFRHPTWFNEQTYQLLRKNNIALVLVSHPWLPTVEVITANFVYLRWHGKDKLYASNYSRQELTSWATKIKSWLKSGLDVYGYFNNDFRGFAPQNAQTLLHLL